MEKMSYKNPTAKRGGLLKKGGDYASHPDYQPGKVPSSSPKVRDVGSGNFNAPVVGRVNHEGGMMHPGKKKMPGMDE